MSKSRPVDLIWPVSWLDVAHQASTHLWLLLKKTKTHSNVYWFGQLFMIHLFKFSIYRESVLRSRPEKLLLLLGRTNTDGVFISVSD